MLKFFKIVDEKKLYVNEEAKFVDGEGNVVEQKDAVEVPESDTEAVDVEAGVDDAAKMIQAAMSKAAEAGEKSLEETRKTAELWLKTLELKVQDQANKNAVQITKDADGFDVKALVEGAKTKVGRGMKGSHVVALSEKDINAITKSTSIGSDLTGDVIRPDRDTEIGRDPQRQVFMEDIADVAPTDSDTVEWVEVTTETGAPATTAELGAIPEKDYAFQTYRAAVEKIAVMNKHSVELLKHGPELVSAIRRMLTVDLNIVVDGQLLSGNGTTPNLQGVLGVATELDATAVGAQRVDNANLFDVLRIAGTKIASAGKGKYVPNFVVLHPDDTEKFDLTKDTDGNYIMPPFYDAAGRRIRGARIIENTAITSGTFLMGDFRYMHVRTKGGVEVELTNSDGTDFANDILSIKMRRFLAAYVKNNDNAAFQTGTIADVITALGAA